MFEFPKADKKILSILLLILCLIGGFIFGYYYQPEKKTIKIYSQALNNYNNKNFSNSYYLFSRVGYFSKLKPFALYRQSLCAKSLNDEKSEYLVLHKLLRHFPSSHLSTEAKYRIAQLLTKSNPKKAKKYFNQIIISNSDKEYKIASKYFKSKIELNEYKNNKSLNSITEIESGFRDYILNYPNGKFALDTLNCWLELNPTPILADTILIARTYYKLGFYEKSMQLLENINIRYSWALLGSVLLTQGDILNGTDLILTGVNKYSDTVNLFDYKTAVDLYIQNSQDYSKSSTDLFIQSNGKFKDYIWYLKCKYSPLSSRQNCYENFYLANTKSEYTQDVMVDLIIEKIIKKDYTGAKNIADSFMLNYPNSKNLSKVMFWRAKIEQKYTKNPNYEIFYRNVINNFPDTYYAYRSFFILNNIKSATIKPALTLKPVAYPYKYPIKGSALYYLLLVEDYDMIDRYTQDEFIKSWTAYVRGNYTSSLFKAQQAMENLKTKPPKTDVRWRLVYPMNYYQQIKKDISQTNLDIALILSLIKEESYFNPEAQSSVGAIGLMQLMPLTAHDIGEKNGYNFNTKDLFNPELNIKLGNIYYSNLVYDLNNDLLAVASYNGGIGSVKKWLEILKYSDIDEFIEQIPYKETQNYVKKVFKSYWNYSRIYGD